MIQFQSNLSSLLFFPLFALPLIAATLASDCNRTCGSNTVPYPFGFSAACHIRLNCTAGKVKIGRFSVRKVTSYGILLDVPLTCDRTIRSAIDLFGQNYALTRRNGLFLRGCGSNSTVACSISAEMVSNQMNYSGCESKKEKLTCYANVTSGGSGGEFLSKKEVVDATGCGYLVTSVTYDEQNLTLSEAELGWWMDGTCRCSANANCTRVRSPVSGGDGFRCRCEDGYEGDGFAGSGAGGCVKVSTCGSSGYMSGKCGGSSRVGVLVGGIIAGGSIMAGVVIVIFLVRRCCTSSKIRKNTRCLLSEASFNVPFYPYKAIERATDNFSDTLRLGTGAYGTVYVGNLTNGELVAVKKIKHPEPETVEQVMNEVKMISSVNHPNLVRLLGCCFERGEQILVYEFMPNGTLTQHLQRQRGPGLPWTVRLAVAIGTAKAITYLHSADPPIYHRDIKSSNILLDQQFNAKIADFGLSRAVVTDFSHISTAPQGTPGYVDPQYHQNYHLSDKSDVYSFGVVLIEIITGLKVVDFNRGQGEVNLAAMAVDRIAKGRVDEIIDPFLHTQKDSWGFVSIHKVAELAFRCLAFHRDMRPSMMEVADELEQIRSSCWAPKDGDVVVPSPVELCMSPLMEGGDRVQSEGESKRLVIVSRRVEEEVNSPVSVQDNWVSEQSTPSSSSLLGYSNK